jgi:hypothetical protein
MMQQFNNFLEKKIKIHNEKNAFAENRIKFNYFF